MIKYSKAAAKKFRICKTPEEMQKGKEHAATVKAYYGGEGEPERWNELVKLVEEQWPGFKVVEEIANRK